MSVPFQGLTGPPPGPIGFDPSMLGILGGPPAPPGPALGPIPSPAHMLSPQGPQLFPQGPAPVMPANPTAQYLAVIQQQLQEPEKTPKAVYKKPTKPKGMKTPNIDDIRIRADKLVSTWQPRDSRMDEDLGLYRLTKDTAGEGELIVKNTPYVVVEKAANMIASQTPSVQVVAPKQESHEAAQKIESFLRWSGEKWNKQWRRSQLQGSIRHDMAHFLCLRGWVAARISYDSEADDTEYPIQFKLFDPRQVYPKMGNKNLEYLVHRYWTTYGELIEEWPDQAHEFEEREPTDYVEVTSYYDVWFHCTYTDEKVLKKVTAHEYGFVPWVIVTGNGSPIRATGQNQTSWVRECGVSIFHGIKDSYKEMNKVLSQLATQVANAANPPMLYYYDPAMNKIPTRLDITPGTTNFLLYDRERVDPLNLSPRPTDASPLIDSLVDDVNKGSLNSILWGQGGTESGWNTSIMLDAARDQLFTVIEAMQEAFEQANEYTLYLIRDQHDGEIGFWITTGDGRPTGGITITPEEIEQVGCDNIVRYRDVSPKDRAAMAQLASMLVKDHIISMETAREDYLFIDNPEREEQRVMSDLVKMDPDVIKKGLVPATLMVTDPDLFSLYMGIHPEIMSNQPPTDQPGPLPPQLPQPAPGLPPTAQPPIGQPGANPLMQSLGSMVGGAGGTGAPPQLPGTGMQTPLGLPLGL